MRHDELRDELLALLAANRELGNSADEVLVEGLLQTIQARQSRPAWHPDLRAAYDALLPVRPSTLLAVALTQGLIVLLLGQYTVTQVLNLTVDSYNFVPAWTMFGVIWLVEVIATITLLSRVVAQHARRSERHDDRRSGANPELL